MNKTWGDTGYRIGTEFEYPDGDLIDVFLTKRDGQFLLTDLGETVRWALTVGILDGEETQEQTAICRDECLAANVTRTGGALETPLGRGEDLDVGIYRLARAAHRLAYRWSVSKKAEG